MSKHDCASCYCCCDCRHVICDTAVCRVPLQHFCDRVTLIFACIIIIIIIIINTCNAIPVTLEMSGEQIRLQVPPKLFGVNSWITQMIRQ